MLAYTKEFSQTITGLKKTEESKKPFGPKKSLVQKKIWYKGMFGPKKIWFK